MPSMMAGTALAASSLLTVMRTISEPARAEGSDLLNSGFDVGCVGVGHRLDDDRGVGADANISDRDSDSFSAVNDWHINYQFTILLTWEAFSRAPGRTHKSDRQAELDCGAVGHTKAASAEEEAELDGCSVTLE